MARGLLATALLFVLGARAPAAVAAAGDSDLEQAGALIHAGRYAEAREAATHALRAALATRDQAGATRALLRIADTHYYEGRPAEYAAEVGRALRAARASGDAALVGRCYYSLAYVHERREPKRMLALLARARERAAAAGDDQLLMNVDNASGQALLALGRLTQSREAFGRSAATAERLKDDAARAVALTNLAVIENYRGRGQEALRAFDAVLPLVEARADRHNLAVVLNGASDARTLVGDLEQALALRQRALAVLRASADRQLEAATLEGLAELHARLGDARSAERLLREALGVAQALDDRRRTVRLLERLAQRLLESERRDEARAALAQARPLARAHGDPLLEQLLALARARTWSAEAPERCLQELQAARGLLAQAGAVERAEAHALRGACLAAAGRTDEARGAYEAALALGEAARNALALPSWRARLARLQAQAGLRGDARATWARAVRDLERLDEQLTSEGFRLSLFAQGADVFHGLAGFLAAAGRAEEALRTLEQGRARELRLRLVAAGQATAQADALEREALARLANLRRVLMDAAPERQPALLSELRLAELECDRARARKARAPAERLPPASFPPEALALAYARDGDALLVFSHDERGVRARRLDHAVALLLEAERFAAGIARRDDPAGLARQGRRLYDALVGPELTEARATHVVLAADDVLHRLPFTALRDERGRFLVERVALSYVPSFGVLAELRAAPGPAGREARVLAVAERGDSGEPLEAAADEARDVARYGPGARLLLDADEGQLLREPLADADVLHFAAHVRADALRPERSAIVLRAGSGQDGALEARELHALRLRARLVVVSGCSSGSGRVLPGEGLLGLSHALLSAGARSAVLSLWDVRDAAAATLMRRFYAGLGRLSIGEALAQAQREAAQGGAYGHPADWAAFCVIGDANQRLGLVARADVRPLLALVAVALLLAAGVLYRRYSTRSS